MRLFSLGAFVAWFADSEPTPTSTVLEDRLEEMERTIGIQQGQIIALNQMLRDATGLVIANSNRISRLNEATGDFAELTDVMYVDGNGDVIVEGVNLRIVNGSGHTDMLDGTGNLLLGYDVDCDDCLLAGSHNIVLGRDNAYLSHSGIVTGAGNTLHGPHSVVLAGSDCTVSDRAVVIGGTGNAALGIGAVAIAGQSNTASGAASSIVSGTEGLSEGATSVVVGGSRNEAAGAGSAVFGGVGGVATDRYQSLP